MKMVYEKEEFRLSLMHQNCMNVCIRGYNCCQTGGIEVSSCLNVYI